MKINDILDRPIAFHRCFVSLTGSIASALMLSQAVYWSKRTEDPDGWFYKKVEEWEEETGLKKYEQEGARRLLNKTSFWKERRSGIPCKLFFCVDSSALADSLRNLPPENKTWLKAKSGNGSKPTPDLAKPENYKGTESTSDIKNLYSEPFLAFWKSYPKKHGKGEAWKEWQRGKFDQETVISIMRSVEVHKRTRKWAEGYILDPCRFIKRRCWEDEIAQNEFVGSQQEEESSAPKRFSFDMTPEEKAFYAKHDSMRQAPEAERKPQ